MIQDKKYNPGHVWLDTQGDPINAHGGGMLWHEGLYYWFGEHKSAGPAGNKAYVGVRVYSSKDLYGWKNEGVALQVSDDASSPIAHGCILERPKVIFNRRTGKFVMWFHLEPKGAGYSGALSGVAISESPVGPYRFLGSLRPNAGVWPLNTSTALRKQLTVPEAQYLAKLDLPGGPRSYYPRDLIFRRDFARGQMARDMTLFVDDEGSAYHIYASEDNGTLHISLLSDDYTKPAGKYVRVSPGRFHEAPTIFKAFGRYFMITSDCTGWTPNTARLLVADSMWGPWLEHGTPCIGSGAEIANTFESQGTFVLPLRDANGVFIFMADRWRPENGIDGRYVWLPISFEHGMPIIRWSREWRWEELIPKPVVGGIDPLAMLTH